MTRPVPILFVIDYFRDPNAGTEGQLKQLISHLDRDRFAPRLLVFKHSDYLGQEGFPCPVSVLGASSLSSPGMWWALFRFAREQFRQGVRLAHVYFNDASVIGPPIFAMTGIKTIISRRDMGYWYTPMYRTLLKITGRFVTRVIVNSCAMGEVTANVENIPRDRISVIHNGYKPQEVGGDVIAVLEAIRGKGALIAGLVANIRPIKRMQDAIIAVALLRDRGVAMQLVIIGAGDSAELVALAKQRGVEDCVHFLGAREDVQQCLQYFDVALLCSESEGFSNAIVEYQFAGLPVICTNTGGNPEAIINGRTGFLFEVGDVPALADLLHRLISDKGLRRTMGREAVESAAERFSVARMVSEHERIYGELLGRLLGSPDLEKSRPEATR